MILGSILARALLTLLQDQSLLHFWVPSKPAQNHEMGSVPLSPWGCSSDYSGQAPVGGLFPESLKSKYSFLGHSPLFILHPSLQLSQRQSGTHISLIFRLLPTISGPGNRQGFSTSYPPCSVFHLSLNGRQGNALYSVDRDICLVHFRC